MLRQCAATVTMSDGGSLFVSITECSAGVARTGHELIGESARNGVGETNCRDAHADRGNCVPARIKKRHAKAADTPSPFFQVLCVAALSGLPQFGMQSVEVRNAVRCVSDQCAE